MATATTAYRSSQEVANLLQTNYMHLMQMIHRGQIVPPALRWGTAYLWSQAEIARARELLEAHRDTANRRLRERGRAIIAYGRKLMAEAEAKAKAKKKGKQS